MLDKTEPLSCIEPGQHARVVRMEVREELNRRLRDLGLIEGTLVECLHQAPFGDPAAYQIRGAVIALRKEDSAGIFTIPFPTESHKKGRNL